MQSQRKFRELEFCQATGFSNEIPCWQLGKVNPKIFCKGADIFGCWRLHDYSRDVNFCQQHYRGDTNLYMIDATLKNLFASSSQRPITMYSM